MNTDFLKIENETEQEFLSIAKKLLNEFAIENHESIYRLTEIELYWNSKTHKDESTYKRIHVKPQNGDWYFHYSGVDIALKNEATGGFGGILIRGIYSLKEEKLYKGPMVCAMKLFSGTNAFSDSIKTRIIEYKFEEKAINKKPRVGLGENAKKSGTEKREYNFYI